MGIKHTYSAETIANIADVKCLGEMVIIKPAADTEIGGIIIPVTAQEKCQKGLVVKVGPGTKDVDIEVEPGEKILHVKWAGSEVSVDGEKFIFMKQEDILGKYHGEREIDLTPLEDRILIEWEYGDDVYTGTNISRAEGSAKERYYTGIILAVGPKVKDPENITIGQRIYFNQFCGPERITFENKRYAMIWEDDARCVVPLRKTMMVLSH